MITVFVEHDRGLVTPSSLAALTLGRRIAGSLDLPLHAIAIGDEDVQELAAYGVGAVHAARIDGGYAPAAWAQALVEAIDAHSPRAVLAAGTDRGNEVMAHVGAKTGAPMTANCIDVEPGDAFTITRQRWGGTVLEEARVTAPVQLLTTAPHAFAPEPATAAGEATVEPFTPKISDDDVRVRAVVREAGAGGKVALPEARLVIGGGRGVGSAERFAILDDLAGLLGGVVGVSRAVTSLGWRPHAEQIGQTGARIAPELYVACGISGASQHIVGCRGAKRILAINTDPEAPILSRADYAVIGDLHEVVPAVIEEIRRRRQ